MTPPFHYLRRSKQPHHMSVGIPKSRPDNGGLFIQATTAGEAILWRKFEPVHALRFTSIDDLGAQVLHFVYDNDRRR